MPQPAKQIPSLRYGMTKNMPAFCVYADRHKPQILPFDYAQGRLFRYAPLRMTPFQRTELLCVKR
jgi:hypothetical protein